MLINSFGILVPMSKSNITETEQGIGSEVDHFVYRVPKKNHDSTVQLSKEFGDIIRQYGVAHLVFQLNNTEAPMEGITNIAKTVSATQEEEVWLELLFYRDHKHKDEVGAKMRNDERMGPLWQRSLELVSPGTGFIMGEFSRSKI
jgi:uncharacterized protein YbaA (DUF1428 family)